MAPILTPFNGGVAFNPEKQVFVGVTRSETIIPTADIVQQIMAQTTFVLPGYKKGVIHMFQYGRMISMIRIRNLIFDGPFQLLLRGASEVPIEAGSAGQFTINPFYSRKELGGHPPLFIKPGWSWPVPKDCILFLGVSWASSSLSYVNGDTPREACYAVPPSGATGPTFFLVAYPSQSPHMYVLPLPNMHQDGKICLGTVTAESTMRLTGDVESWLEYVVQALYDTTWNQELTVPGAGELGMKQLIAFKPDGTPIPSQVHWTTLSARISDPCNPFFTILGRYLMANPAWVKGETV